MIRLIAAIDEKRGLAKTGLLPWDIPDDRKFFRTQTTGQGGVILMGRKTFENIGHPLPARRNIVLSKQNKPFTGAETTNNLTILNTLSDVWVIGGEEVFRQTFNQADELYLTHIEADFDCDQFFPAYANNFVQSWRSETKEQNGLRFWFEILVRRSQ